MTKQTGETIYYKHNDFTMFVSCDDLDSPRAKLTNTYSQRGIAPPDGESIAVLIDGSAATTDLGAAITLPFFFENRQYWFEIEFTAAVEKNSPYVSHKYRLIEQSFKLSARRNTLQAMLNFGNDIGKCAFNIHYRANGVTKAVAVQFNVFATKMVVSADLGLMNQKIDSVYPFWRYAISGKTTQSQGKSIRQPEKFELFWLAQFERLVDEFNQGLKRVINAPHNRLQLFTKQQKLERINKKLSAKQQELAIELIAAKRLNSRMQIGYKRLHLDTPENRFIKMVINKTKLHLAKIIQVIKNNKDSKVSESFFNTLDGWHKNICKVAQHPLWQEVSAFDGMNSESKVLQQAAGYSKVYKIWQQLKYYLNQANGEAELSIKSVADIYEVWCFIEVRSIVLSLGFTEQEKRLSKLKQVQFEKQFPQDEMAAAFIFRRDSDDMIIELAHEPSFTPKGSVNRTWLANQRPDIVMRVTLANKESFLILFDAKYRIDSQPFSNKDAVPEDAINQMHRYRDSIIHQQRLAHESPLKSRPVMGAFALYPGFFDQEHEENPYTEAINEIGIGAFALLPSADSHKPQNQWLRSYLINKLGVGNQKQLYAKPPSNDYYFVEDAVRIGPYGANTVRHHGLTMIAPLNEINRNEDYLQKAISGKLQGYHTQLLATNRQNIHRNIVREIRYLIVTVRDKSSDTYQLGKYLYRISSVKLLPRHDIARELTGKESDDNHHYWLFEFAGEPEKLSSVIEKPYTDSFAFKLTKAEYLHQFKHWDDVKESLQLYTGFDATY
ncbi:DUF2357 domain-containing protein [Rheinheimera salexigens]|uniref:DUF2357 domain-containing protein n=1 Tax=Rheinheimera salexigens TaxID=1628148 RepID=A0A1E7Q3E3_9GAMM|nr:DUF2357 domain-containing protein [Rheinheimera salexigens]OEY68712.1 hypothetical protein BI198_03350 [Rheinheimera salexigens]